jgi:hypothetical protein
MAKNGMLRSGLLMAAAAGLLAACGGKLAVPGPVKVVAPGKLGGEFRILARPKSQGGVDSDGRGGACIVVAMHDVRGFEQMQCAAPGRSCGPGPAGMNDGSWYAYCDLPPDARAGETGQCWGKPAGRPEPLQQQLDRQFCNRSLDYSPLKIWPVGPHIPANQEPIDLAQEALGGVARRSRWRISACVVRADDGKLECRWGPITEMP